MSLPVRSNEGDEPDDLEHEQQVADAARREHALQSLVELGHELTVALDVYETADLLLFNLMGQLGTARSALWLVPEEGETDGSGAVLVRAYGFHRPVVGAIGSAFAHALRRRFALERRPVLAWAIRDAVESAEFDLVRHAEIALFAPLHARDELLGWLALGPRVDGTAYGPPSLQVLEAALGMVGVSLQNTRLYNRACETNRRLRVSNEHLAELDRLKTDFLSNVNHELRTPLAVVVATLECVIDLGQGGSGDARARDLLASSLAQSRKLQGLIENLLRFSELRESRIVLDVGADDAGAVLDACHRTRLPGVTAGLRELTLQRDPYLPRARFDPARLLQILDELVDNAVKFTPRGTHIELRADKVREDERDWVRIEVIDDGPGIDPARVGSVFHSFEQGDGSSTRQVGGLGMGLAYARELAERMEGRLTVDTAIGRGSTFRLLLPVA